MLLMLQQSPLTLGHCPRTLAPGPITTGAPPSTVGTPKPSLLLKITPPLHRNLAAIKLTVLVMAAFARALELAGRLAGVAPGEVVEVPVGVDGEDEVPDGQGDEVDEHPGDVGDAVGGYDD